MSIPFHFYEDTFANVNSTLASYVGDTSASVVGAIGGFAYSLLMIYVILWGWSMLRGLISEPVTDGMTRIIRLTIISALALESGRYNTYIANFLSSTPDALAAVVVSGGAGSPSVQFLDGLMTKIFDIGTAFWTAGMAPTIPNFGMLLIALAIWAIGIAGTAYGAFLLCLSKMALAILLGLGPIFILSLIFEGTKKFFEAWLGQVMNYVFLTVLTASALKLIFTILDTYLNNNGAAIMATPGIPQILPVVVLCLIGLLVMMQMPSVASALGGGTAISTLGAVGWAYGKAKAGASMRPTNLRRSAMGAKRDAALVGAALNRATGGLAGRAAGAAGSAARSGVRGASYGAGYVGGRAAGAPMAVYRKITSSRTNAVSKG